MTGAESAGSEADAARAVGAGAQAAGTDLDVPGLVSFYQQQLGSVNQLWTMFAATTFAAGLFAFNVGQGGQSVALLLAGASGFLFFAFGHAMMVFSAMTRLNLAARHLAETLTEEERAERPARSLVAYLARGERRADALVVHILIDACVFATFAAQLWRLGGWKALGL